MQSPLTELRGWAREFLESGVDAIDQSLAPFYRCCYQVVELLDDGALDADPELVDVTEESASLLTQLLVSRSPVAGLEFEDRTENTIFSLADIVYALYGRLLCASVKTHRQAGEPATIGAFEDAFTDIAQCRRDHPDLCARWDTPIDSFNDKEIVAVVDALCAAHRSVAYHAEETWALVRHLEASVHRQLFISGTGSDRTQKRLCFIFLEFRRYMAYLENARLVPVAPPAGTAEMFCDFQHYFRATMAETRLTDQQDQAFIDMVHRVHLLPGEHEFFRMRFPNDRASAPALLVAGRSKEEIDRLADLVDVPLAKMYDKAEPLVRFAVARQMLDAIFMTRTSLELTEYVLDNPDLESLTPSDIAVVRLVNQYGVFFRGRFYLPAQDPLRVFFLFFYTIETELDGVLDGFDLGLLLRAMGIRRD